MPSWLKNTLKIAATIAVVAACVAISAVTCGGAAAAMVVVSTVVSVAAQGVSDLKNGELSSLDSYLGAAIGGAISGLGNGIGTTMLSSGIGEIASGLISGSISSVEDAMVIFALGTSTALLGYGIGKSISRFKCASKLYDIIGDSTKNRAINKKIANAGYKALKIGKGGMAKLANDFYETAGYGLMSDVIEQVYGFIIGTVF